MKKIIGANINRVFITGGAGFIGSHLVRLLVNKYPNYHIINMDVLTYAGNLENLKDIEYKENYTFVKCDICDVEKVNQVFKKYQIDSVIHLAAESHVDRSINDPFSFAQTNVMGTLNLLQAAKESWNGNFTNHLFYHVSTDEVYGSLGEEGFFTEEDAKEILYKKNIWSDELETELQLAKDTIPKLNHSIIECEFRSIEKNYL